MIIVIFPFRLSLLEEKLKINKHKDVLTLVNLTTKLKPLDQVPLYDASDDPIGDRINSCCMYKPLISL